VPDASTRELLKNRGYANPSVVAGAYYHSNRALGGAADVVPLPAADAKPEAWDAFYKKMGRPDDANGYKFEYPKDFTPDPAMEQFGRTFLHKLGIPASRANAAMAMWNEFAGQQNQAAAAVNDQQVAQLKTSLGDKYDPFIAAAKRAVEGLGLEQADMAALEKNIGAAAVLRLYAKLGQLSAEGKLPGNSNGNGGGGGDINGLSPEQAQGEITKLNADQEFQKAYMDGNHPMHADAVKRMEALHARAMTRKAS
jgi:hypothetical protein